MDEILKFAIETGIINMPGVQSKIAMKKRKELLEKHTYKIWKGNDGKWRTYLPDKEKGRRMIKKNSQEEVEDTVCKFYSNGEIPKTFDSAYWHWRNVQDEFLCDNSIVKYNSDYKRHFKDSDFSQQSLSSINQEDIQLFIIKEVKDKKLCKESCKRLLGYIKNTLDSAKINHWIEENPADAIKAKSFYKYCTETIKTAETKTISKEDMERLKKLLGISYEKHPEYIPAYAVEFASLTGMRVGEISALKWEDISEECIIIQRSEKYNRIEKKYFIDDTKNGKTRVFPVTEPISKLLSTIKKAEMAHGYCCEWVFANENGRVHAPVISSCIKNKCRQAHISERGIHALRMTLNSKLRCDGVSATVAASLLGHSPEVNEKYYTFDVTSLKEKAEIISRVEMLG